MNRRGFLKQISIGSVALTLGQFCNAFSLPKKDFPNILWIVSEDNGPFLGCYGDKLATTPNLDKLAAQGILYQNAFSNAPVCAPARCTIITGMYPPGLGTGHMRSSYLSPSFIKFLPKYLKDAGYYCTNNFKKDYNTPSPENIWNISSKKAHYKNRQPNQPFFSVFNIAISHESSIQQPLARLSHDPAKVTLPPYHPDIPQIRHDWAQYYDKVQQMDAKVGQFLKELDDLGLTENTIVFYYADNGGVLPRSKRFLYDTGVKVPLIVRFGKKYQHLAPAKSGTKTDRLISFVDLAPTLLSLAGIKVPNYMQGSAFLGKQKTADRQYVYLYRDRMDERYDMSRALRDKNFKYIRNYMPHRIYGQHLTYLWKTPATRAWQQAFEDGKCNQIQSIFWKTKPDEELYDIKTDPYEMNNLAENPKYKSTLLSMRQEIKRWVRQIRDKGFIPEAMLMDMTKDRCGYDVVNDPGFAIERIIETAELATEKEPAKLPVIIERLTDPEPAVRYWAAVGCAVLGQNALPACEKLTANLTHPSANIRIASAEALCKLGLPENAVAVLTNALDDKNSKAVLHALNVLEVIGDQAKPAAEKIKYLAEKSNDLYIRDAAAYTAAKFD